jgi:hypothetical protein
MIGMFVSGAGLNSGEFSYGWCLWFGVKKRRGSPSGRLFRSSVQTAYSVRGGRNAGAVFDLEIERLTAATGLGAAAQTWALSKTSVFACTHVTVRRSMRGRLALSEQMFNYRFLATCGFLSGGRQLTAVTVVELNRKRWGEIQGLDSRLRGNDGVVGVAVDTSGKNCITPALKALAEGAGTTCPRIYLRLILQLKSDV